MSRRLVAVLLAVVLALAGAGVLFVYVSGAEQRAMQGLKPVTVWRVIEEVPEGTPAEGLADLVEAQEVPAKSVAEGAVSRLDEVDGMVVTADLQPGEQLLQARFGDAEEFESSRPVDIPEDMQQVSLLLEPERVLGGFLEPKATVAVFVSMEEPPETRLVSNKTLVTRVQNGITLPRGASESEGTDEPVDEEVDPAAAAPPAEGVMVTLAVELNIAEDIVFGAEHGTVWLTIQPDEAEDGGDRLVDRAQVLK